jgi:hypothetical protein
MRQTVTVLISSSRMRDRGGRQHSSRSAAMVAMSAMARIGGWYDRNVNRLITSASSLW